jgi:hypothetical protein
MSADVSSDVSSNDFFVSLTNLAKLTRSRDDDKEKIKLLTRVVREDRQDVLEVLLNCNYFLPPKKDILKIIGSSASVKMLTYIYENLSSFPMLSTDEFHDDIFLEFDRVDFLHASYQEHKSNKGKEKYENFFSFFNNRLKNKRPGQIYRNISNHCATRVANYIYDDKFCQDNGLIFGLYVQYDMLINIVEEVQDGELEKLEKVKQYFFTPCNSDKISTLENDMVTKNEGGVLSAKFKSLELFIFFFNQFTGGQNGDSNSHCRNRHCHDNKYWKNVCEDQMNYRVIKWLLKESAVKDQIFVSYFSTLTPSFGDQYLYNHLFKNVDNIEIIELFLSSARVNEDFITI